MVSLVYILGVRGGSPLIRYVMYSALLWPLINEVHVYEDIRSYRDTA